MNTNWNTRRLLICKYLLLQQNNTTVVLTPEHLFFAISYPRPTYLWTEHLEVIKCLLSLQQEGYLELADIKIDRGYLKLFQDVRGIRQQAPDTVAAMEAAHFGLSPQVLAKVQNGTNISAAEYIHLFAAQLKGFSPREDTAYPLYFSEKPLDLEGFGTRFVNHSFIFALNIARYSSFVIKINKEILSAGLRNYITDFQLGLLNSESKRYFSYEVQKRTLLHAVKSLANKQGNKNVQWWFGYLNTREFVIQHLLMDEFLSVLQIDFPEYCQTLNEESEELVHQYDFAFYETLFSLEQEGIISLNYLGMVYGGTVLSHAGVSLHDSQNTLAKLSFDITNSELLKQSIAPPGSYTVALIPVGVHWENIIFEFMNEHTIKVKSDSGLFSPFNKSIEEMNMASLKNGEANAQWKFLLKLRTQGGEVKTDSRSKKGRAESQQKRLLTLAL